MPKPVDVADLTTPVKIGRFLSPEELGSSVHEAAVRGDKKKLKRLLRTGIPVDYTNSAGQTPLFCACFEGHEGAVNILLANGANSNLRSNEGSTAVHAAGYSCNPKILTKVIEAGGDLRLHDGKGRMVKEWALCQKDVKKRRKMLEYLDKTKHVAMSGSCRDLMQKQSSTWSSSRQESLGNLLRLRSSHKALTLSPSVKSHGYGKIYLGDKEHVGTMATIPLVAENVLRHDEYGYTYNNGPFMVMESMLWNKIPVTVKRLHRDPPEGGQVDLLIKENEHMACLRHPNILLLMGVCQTNNLDGLVLLYERVGCGSLYSYLYQKVETLDTLSMCEVMKQISDALLYMHQQNLLHCNITSHAIQMVLPNFAKLSNLEYAIDSSSTDGNHGPKSKVVENKYLNAAYNWVAPELLAGKAPSEKSDLYSLCSVMWEVLHGMPPWSGMHASEIQNEVVENKTMLEIKETVKNPFCVVLQYGLSVEPKSRQLTVEQFRDILGQVLVDHNSMGIKGDTPHPQRKRKFSAKQVKSSQEPMSSGEEETMDMQKGKKMISKSPMAQNKMSPLARESSLGSDSETLVQSIVSPRAPEKTPRTSKDSTLKDPDPRGDHVDGLTENTTEPEVVEAVIEAQAAPPRKFSPHPVARAERASRRPASPVTRLEGDKEANNSNNSASNRSSSGSSAEMVFIKDRAKRQFFKDSFCKPKSTSTPTSQSPASPSFTLTEVIASSKTEVATTQPETLSAPTRSADGATTRPSFQQDSIVSPTDGHRYGQEIRGASRIPDAKIPRITKPQETDAASSAELHVIRQTVFQENAETPRSADSNPFRQGLYQESGETAPSGDGNPFRKTLEQPDQDLNALVADIHKMASKPSLCAFKSSTAVGDHRKFESHRKTVYGALMKEYAAIARPNISSTLKSNYFIATDKATPSCPPDPSGDFQAKVRTCKDPWEARMGPGARFSYTDTYNIGTPVRQPQESQTSVGSRHSWAVLQNRQETPGVFKPASHRAQFTPSPTRPVEPTADHVRFSVPEPKQHQATCPGSPIVTASQRMLAASASSTGGPKAHACGDEPDGRRQHLASYAPSPFRSEGCLRAKSSQVYSTPAPAQGAKMYGSPPHGEAAQLYGTPQAPPSPRDQKEEWYGGDGSIQDLITSFQGKAEEHFMKQAVLVLKSKQQEPHCHVTQQQGDWSASSAKLLSTSRQGADSIQRADPKYSSEQKNCEGNCMGRQISKATFNIGKTVDVSSLKYPMGSASELDYCPSAERIQSCNSFNRCPSQMHANYLNGMQESDSSETDHDASAVVRDALHSAQSQLVQEYTHPACPHKVDSLAFIRDRFHSNVNVSNNRGDGHLTTKTTGCQWLPLDGDTKVNAGKPRGITVEAGSQTDIRHNSSEVEYPRSAQLSDVSRRTTDEIEEFYFDDVLNCDLLKERHMRLQNTLPLDECPSPWSPASGATTMTPSLLAMRSMSVDSWTTTQSQEDCNNRPESKCNDGDLSGSRVGELKLRKRHVHLSPREGCTTTVRVESDTSGNHVITEKTTNHNTGKTCSSTEKVKASKVVTSIVLEDDEVPV